MNLEIDKDKSGKTFKFYHRAPRGSEATKAKAYAISDITNDRVLEKIPGTKERYGNNYLNIERFVMYISQFEEVVIPI